MNSSIHHQLEEIVGFGSAGPTKTVFYESEKLKVQVMGLEAGQKIPPCSMAHDVIFVVLDGAGEVITDGQQRSVRKASWVFVPKETKLRSIEAETRMTVLAVQVK